MKNFSFFFFFFLLFCILPLLVSGKITTYLFFRNSNLKCPKLPLSALKFPFIQINYFFFALYSFSLPPKHFLITFSGKLTTKNVQKSSLKDKNKFSFFYKLFYIFLLPLRKKTKPLTFSALFITGNRKTAKENVPYKIFFSSFFFYFLHPTAPGNLKNYQVPFFTKFRLQVP